MHLLQELLTIVPKKFKVGDKFWIDNNERQFVISVLEIDSPAEIKIKTSSKEKDRESYTDALELAARLRLAKSWKRLA